MSHPNSLGHLRAVLNPGGQQRLFEFLDGVDTETAARFRQWLSTANPTQLGAVANLLDHSAHGREFAGWWRTHDRAPVTPTPVRPADEPPQNKPVKETRAKSGNRSAAYDVKFGTIWLVGGLLVTLVTYSLAASNPRGGSFIVASGAMLYGAMRLLRGLKAGR